MEDQEHRSERKRMFMIATREKNEEYESAKNTESLKKRRIAGHDR
jgi:hypothetical protein